MGRSSISNTGNGNRNSRAGKRKLKSVRRYPAYRQVVCRLQRRSQSRAVDRRNGQGQPESRTRIRRGTAGKQQKRIRVPAENYARNKILFEKKLISDSDYETSTYNYEKAKAAYEQNQAAMVKVNRNLEYATITSPIDGVVINRAVEEGQTVAAGFETPTLFTIAADLTKMQVIADVDEADIGNVHDGQRVSFTVDAYPNDVFEGTVWQIRLGDSSSSSSSSSTSSSSTVVTYEVVDYRRQSGPETETPSDGQRDDLHARTQITS